MARAANSFKRSGHRFKEQPTVLVICEDSKSGKQYLEDACSFFRINAKVRVAHCGKTDPKGIVEEAIQSQNSFDELYCVIDRDRHPSFDEALVIGRAVEKLKVIASYPCFEFWLLLHFGYNNKPYTEEGNRSPGYCLVKDLRQIPEFENYDKGDCGSIFDMLGIERLNTARKVSRKVLADALSNGSMNPSTQIHELIDRFEELGNPTPIG